VTRGDALAIDRLLEVSDGATDIAYRLTVAPAKVFE
jgi:hypothetical protein